MWTMLVEAWKPWLSTEAILLGMFWCKNLYAYIYIFFQLNIIAISLLCYLEIFVKLRNENAVVCSRDILNPRLID